MNVFALGFGKVQSLKGFTHVLIGNDYFSGFIKTKACRSQSVIEVTSFSSNAVVRVMGSSNIFRIICM